MNRTFHVAAAAVFAAGAAANPTLPNPDTSEVVTVALPTVDGDVTPISGGGYRITVFGAPTVHQVNLIVTRSNGDDSPVNRPIYGSPTAAKAR